MKNIKKKCLAQIISPNLSQVFAPDLNIHLQKSQPGFLNKK